jgi:anti-sigma B factor antagonist
VADKEDLMTISTVGATDQSEARHECHVTDDTYHGTLVVRVEGRLDWATAGQLRDALQACEDEPALVIDLGPMTSFDSVGLGVILATMARTTSRDHVVVVATDPETLDVLWAVQVDEVVPVVASLEEASRWLATSSTVSVPSPTRD